MKGWIIGLFAAGLAALAPGCLGGAGDLEPTGSGHHEGEGGDAEAGGGGTNTDGGGGTGGSGDLTSGAGGAGGDAQAVLPPAAPEITAASGRLQGQVYTIDVQLGHGVHQGAIAGSTYALEGAAVVKH